MDHMNILDDILNGGFTATQLADAANAKDQECADGAAVLIEHLKNFETITLQCASDPNYSSSRSVNLMDVIPCVVPSVAHLGIRVPVKVGEYQLNLSPTSTTTGHKYLDSIRTLDQAMKFPESVITDLVMGRVFEAPFVFDGEPAWNAKLPRRSNASEIRDTMLGAVKQALLNGLNGRQEEAGVCDTFSMVITNAGKRRGSPSSGRLGKGQLNGFARLFFSVGTQLTADGIKDQIPHDFGLKNVDDLLCVIMVAAVTFNTRVDGRERFGLARFDNYFQERLRDARAAGVHVDEKPKPEQLKAFIAFLGGKLR